MKNSLIHHLITIRANHGSEIFIDSSPAVGLTSNIKWLHGNIEDIVYDFMFGEGYFFSQIGIHTNRDLTKSEYKRRSHNIRHEEWKMSQHNEEQGYEMDMSGDCRDEEPLLNPGGGPYNPWDNI